MHFKKNLFFGIFCHFGGCLPLPKLYQKCDTGSSRHRVRADMFKNKVVCFSGRFDEFKRVDAELLVTAQGGSIVKQVTQSVDVFVRGTRPGADKLRNAHALGTSTMDEDEFLEGVGLANARLLRAGNVAGLASAGQADNTAATRRAHAFASSFYHLHHRWDDACTFLV